MKTMKAAMKKAMKKKAMKAMKTMKKRKAMKVSKGKNAKASVFRGTKEKTKTGLTKSNLTKSKRGKIVTKKASAAGKRNYKNISGWNKACMAARKALNIKGFCAIGGKSAQGKALLAKARSIYKQ